MSQTRGPSLFSARVANGIVYSIVPLVLVVLWWTLSASSTSPFFPPLSRVLERFSEIWLFDRFLSDFLPSISRMAAGYVLGVLAGIVLGVIFARNKVIYEFLSPYVHFGRALPSVALVPVGIVLLGVGDTMKTVLIASAVLFPVLLSTIDSVSSVTRELQDVAATFHLTRRERIMLVYLPFASPGILAGARTSLSLALILMIISEMLAATNGIGYFTIHAQQTFKIPDVWAGMIMLGLLGIALNLVFALVERRILKWKPDLRESS